MDIFGIFVIVAFVLIALEITDFDTVCTVAFFCFIFGVFDGDDKKEVRPAKTEVNVTIQEQQKQAAKPSERKTKEREAVTVTIEKTKKIKESEIDNEPVRDWTW